MTDKCLLSIDKHQTVLSEAFSSLRNKPEFSDVTLVCEDNQLIIAHKVVLAASSSLFSKILSGIKHSNPLIYFWDTKERDLAKIVDFIYSGQVEIYQSDLSEFLKIAGRLGIKGISRNHPRTAENLTLIETKKETIEKDSYHTKNVVEEIEDDKESYQLGYVKGVEEVSEKENVIDHKNKTEIANSHGFFALPEYEENQVDMENLLEHSNIILQKQRSCDDNMFKGRKSPIWQYFIEDDKHKNFVYCRTCQVRLSRGPIGTSRSKLNTSCMVIHLKKHKDLLHEYLSIKIPRVDRKERKKEEKIYKTKEIEEQIIDIVGRGKKRGQKRGPIWDYYIEDPTDNSFVNCMVCSVKLSRGVTGRSLGKMNSSGMINHLKMHVYVWEKYVEQKKAFRKYPQNRIIDAFNKEGNNIYEPEGSAWQYFEEDPADSNIMTCQVGECCFKVTQDKNGSWSQEELRGHLYTHGYKEK